MARREDWPTIRARLEARGYDLDVVGLLAPPETDGAWAAWDRIEISDDGEGRVGWEDVAPHLEEIERALALPVLGSAERRTFDYMTGTFAAVRAVKGIADGAERAEAEGEAWRRLGLAARVATGLTQLPTLMGALLGVSALRPVFAASRRLTERPLTPAGNAEVREIVAGLALPPWRAVVLGEFRFGLAALDDTSEPRDDDSSLARSLRVRNNRERAKAILAERYAPALFVEGNDLTTFARVAPRLEPSLARASPDRLARLMASRSSGTWPNLPGLYESTLGERRLILLASRAADLPSGAPFAEVLRLRESFGAEGREPLSGRPLEVRDEGGIGFSAPPLAGTSRRCVCPALRARSPRKRPFPRYN